MPQQIDKAALARSLGAVPIEEKRRIALELGATPADAPPPEPPAATENLSPLDRLYRTARIAATAISPPGSENAYANAMDVGTGAIKEVGSTAYNILRNTPVVNRLMPAEKPEFLQPSNTMEQLGATGATAAEYAAPAVVTGGLAAGLGPVARGAARAGLEAAGTAAVSGLRGGTKEDMARDALIAGGMSGAVSLFGPALGQRIEMGLLKPLKAELEQVDAPIGQAGSTMIGNLYKYNLGGTLSQSFQKSTALLRDLGGQLRQVLGSQPGATVDMYRVLADTGRELAGQRGVNFGTNLAIQKELQRVARELNILGGNPSKLNLADANEVKQALGLIGSWVNGNRTADSTAVETVANAMYTKLRLAIENAAGQHGAAVRTLNGKMREIIPIRNAVIRRLPVAQRREIISLKEALALARGDMTGMGLALMDRGLRSGTVANALVQAGKVPGVGAAAAGLVNATQPQE